MHGHGHGPASTGKEGERVGGACGGWINPWNKVESAEQTARNTTLPGVTIVVCFVPNLYLPNSSNIIMKPVLQ